MKWYIWVGILIIAICIFLIVRNQIMIEKTRKRISEQGDRIDKQISENDDLIGQVRIKNNSRFIVEEFINMKYTFDNLKAEALKKGVLVLDSTETHTMEFNPKRVIVKRTQTECINPPCPELLSIESVG